MTTTIDLAGNDLIVESIKVGSRTPGSQGTTLVNSSGVVSVSRIDLDSATATATANAATLTTYAAVVTTVSLTTAAAGTQAITLTKTGVAAGDIAIATLAGGTSTTGTPIIQKAICTTDTVTLTLLNAHASAAFNGTLVINLIICKA